MMEGFLQFVLDVLKWIVYYLVPPITYFSIIGYASLITFGYRGRPSDGLPRLAGYIVGWLLLIVVIMLKVNGYFTFEYPAGPLRLWELIIFGVLGFLTG